MRDIIEKTINGSKKLLVHATGMLHLIQGGIYYGSTTQYASSKCKQNVRNER